MIRRLALRGFYVTSVSRSELEELTRTRCWVEGLALREAMAAATPSWEEALLVAHHRLSRTPRSLSEERFLKEQTEAVGRPQ